MFCAKCGAQVVSGGAYCSKCGAATGAGVDPNRALERPGIVALLAVLQFIGAGLWLLIGGVGIYMLATGDTSDRTAAIIMPILAGIGVLQLICGIGLWNLKPYGRTMQLVFAFIGLLGIPLGTIISIFILIYLFKPGVKALFSGKTAKEMTPAELGAVATLGGEGSAVSVVLIGVVVLIIGVGLIGIVAAIAVPALLRARMAGNEAMAIGSLRFINSAQVSYASAAGKGGYAVTLATLAMPCPGTSQSFISPELAQDPSTKSGFVYALQTAGVPTGETDCNGVPTETDYYATAVPVTFGTTGLRAFSTSSNGTIFFDPSGRAPTRTATLEGSARPIN